jgi:hypothetical protein
MKKNTKKNGKNQIRKTEDKITMYENGDMSDFYKKIKNISTGVGK